MKVVTSIAVALAFLAICGCSATQTPSRSPVTTSLLFDARPGWPMASDMAVRSTWPATPSYAGGEEVWYRERFIDVQTDGWGLGRRHDHVYRRFDTYRVGWAIR